MIKNSEHAYIEWKSKLELVMKEQYNITKQCDYAFGECLLVKKKKSAFVNLVSILMLTNLSLAREDFFFERVALAFPKVTQPKH